RHAPSRLAVAFAGGVITLTSLSLSHAQFLHLGSTDPTLEGWTRIGSGATVGPVNDAGTPAWFTDDTSTAEFTYSFYSSDVSSAQALSARTLGWEVTANVRVPSMNTSLHGSPFAGFSDGQRGFEMFFAGRANGDVEIWLYNIYYDPAPSFTLAGGMS